MIIKWIGRFAILATVGCAGILVYEYHRQGLFSMPDLPQGAYFVSFKNGLRGIVLDAEVPETSTGSGPKFLRSLSIENRSRKYLSIPANVPDWFADAWSLCQRPLEQERTGFINSLPDDVRRTLGTARFEAVCRIEVDRKSLVRGLLFSVPRL